ncbi:uncharacterized protein LOC110697992 [Chenopodium quinoa]|uniref:uncharacterized protein LOC110697992 n=1 Tax=Chenopodium quinoa TaxID=63459 RepID=UPI000B77B9AF|nr:uncharacterized protein LOC110697992 [Chenopodium quinoa]
MGCSYSSPLSKKRLKYRYLTPGVGVGGCKGVGGGKDDIVSLCRERKRLVKKVVKQRHAFADAHCKYFESLSAVAASVAVFVSQYSSSTSKLFIAFGSSDSTAIPQSNSISRIPGSSGENGIEEEERENGVCEFFYGAVEEECKWDFFNVVDEKKKVEEKRQIKEELKEVKQGNENGREIKEDLKKGKQGNEKGNGRELLEALKNLEEYFLRAFDSGKEVSKMLEVTTISSYPDIKENASRKRSISSRSSSCKSFLSSSSRSTSSTWAESGGDRKSLLSCSSDISLTVKENRNDLDGRCGMVSGSHSFTLGRLYAWEKKLYHEVKAGLQTQKIYKKKCSQLQQKDVEGDDLCPSKASSEVTGLYHLMLVALQRAESISNQIEKVRDEELHPQLFELLHGLTRTWKSMSETHDLQRKIMREINSFSCPEHRKFSIDSHCLAAHQLEAAIQDWQSSFSDYVSTQKAYVKSLLGWLSKFIDAESEYHYASRFSLPPMRFNGPPLIVTCKSWSTSLERLPDKSVKHAMKSLGKDLQALWVQQGLEQQQKRKVDGLDKELNRKIRTLGKTEDKALVAKYTAFHKVEEQTESLGEKEQLEMFKQKVETEKERYHSSMQETKRITMNSLQMGFSSVFESLADFSRASAKVYANLVTYSHNANGLKRA